MYCVKCGHKNPEGSRFCALCGGVLEAPDDTTVSLVPDEIEPEDELGVSLEELHTGQALLLVKRGMNTGSRFLLDRDVTTAGRHPSSDIFLNDITVSRRHVEILREGGRFVVKDVGSLNGTYVNRERVDVAELSSGDELQIGKFKLVFFAAPREG
jgi:pSer/pThr/pTyr-binding forkhead associated (FHA) protein